MLSAQDAAGRVSGLALPQYRWDCTPQRLSLTLTEDNIYVTSRERMVCPILGEKCHNIVGLPFDPKPLIHLANEI